MRVKITENGLFSFCDTEIFINLITHTYGLDSKIAHFYQHTVASIRAFLLSLI